MKRMAEFHTVFSFNAGTPQSVRASGRPDQMLSFDSEDAAKAAAATPPKGAKWVMVRQWAPEHRLICRKRVSA